MQWSITIATCCLSCRHLPKNFDNIHNLEFKKDAQGNPTKVAVGMYSGERLG